MRNKRHICLVYLHAGEKYPKGKGASVSTAFEDNKFILPVSKRDEYGELKGPNKWLTTEVNLSLWNYALKEGKN